MEFSGYSESNEANSYNKRRVVMKRSTMQIIAGVLVTAGRADLAKEITRGKAIVSTVDTQGKIRKLREQIKNAQSPETKKKYQDKLKRLQSNIKKSNKT